jgi:hypothetical protein
VKVIERFEKGRYGARGARVVEHFEAHYETQEVPFGVVYSWCPESVVLECGCGEMLTLTGSGIACGECGADHADTVREELLGRQLGDEALHPWRYAGDHEGVGLPY